MPELYGDLYSRMLQDSIDLIPASTSLQLADMTQALATAAQVISTVKKRPSVVYLRRLLKEKCSQDPFLLLKKSKVPYHIVRNHERDVILFLIDNNFVRLNDNYPLISHKRVVQEWADKEGIKVVHTQITPEEATIMTKNSAQERVDRWCETVLSDEEDDEEWDD